jgi:hypothetical protein
MHLEPERDQYHDVAEIVMPGDVGFVELFCRQFGEGMAGFQGGRVRAAIDVELESMEAAIGRGHLNV